MGIATRQRSLHNEGFVLMIRSPPSNLSAPDSALPRRRWRQRLPWVISLIWSLLVLGWLWLSQRHIYVTEGGWKDSPFVEVLVAKGSLYSRFLIDEGARFEGGFARSLRLEFRDLDWKSSPWHGLWDWGHDITVVHGAWWLTVPLWSLLVPPWLWVAWRRWRRRETCE